MSIVIPKLFQYAPSLKTCDRSHIKNGNRYYLGKCHWEKTKFPVPRKELVRDFGNRLQPSFEVVTFRMQTSSKWITLELPCQRLLRKVTLFFTNKLNSPIANDEFFHLALKRSKLFCFASVQSKKNEFWKFKFSKKWKSWFFKILFF